MNRADTLLYLAQNSEAMKRARKLRERLYPNWEMPGHNPFYDDATRAAMMSPERGRYRQLQREKFNEFHERTLAKIRARAADHHTELADESFLQIAAE